MKLRHDLTFIDSFQFMNSSLKNLVKNLKAGELDKFKYIKEFGNFAELLTQKGVYPYSFLNKWEKFDILTNDLKKEDFKNDLTGDEITDEDFKFYNEVCSLMNIQTLGEYHDLYLKTDILLLADVFENFRKTCLNYYELDPCHYFSAPGLAWDACLKMTEIKLELLSDIDMYNFLDKGLRGGVSIITHRKATANNQYMEKFDPSKPSVFIPYLDANNLYGWAMKQNLPSFN
jgi:DNA polymerase type B, organellar and viral